jgi:hypothetical protein
MTTLGRLSLSVGLGTLSLQLVCFVILKAVGNSENSHRCTALIKHPFRNDVRKTLVMLRSIKFCALQFHVNHRSNRFLNLELVLFSLAQTL